MIWAVNNDGAHTAFSSLDTKYDGIKCQGHTDICSPSQLQVV